MIDHVLEIIPEFRCRGGIPGGPVEEEPFIDFLCFIEVLFPGAFCFIIICSNDPIAYPLRDRPAAVELAIHTILAHALNTVEACDTPLDLLAVVALEKLADIVLRDILAAGPADAAKSARDRRP